MKPLHMLFKLILSAILFVSCDSSDPNTAERCKPAKPTNKIAASGDLSGEKEGVQKDWVFESPVKQYSISCVPGSKGSLTVYGVIKDSTNDPKAGIMVGFAITGGLTQVTDQTDVNTDTCGVASTSVTYVCPPSGKTTASQIVPFSGPLFAKDIITVTLTGQ